MKYLLDTNICIHFFRGKYGVKERFEAVQAENCAISEITLVELVFGAENSDNPEKKMSKIAEETRLSRPSLYKALSHGSKPQFETILKVLRAVGGKLNIQNI